MKLFDNASKSDGKQKEMEAEQLRIQQEAGRQKNLEKKLDELILVGKAIYTILKQEHENRKAAYENLENVIQTATSEMIQKQEKAVKIMVAYGREDNQKAITAVKEEFAKVQEASEEVKKQLLAAAEEINNSILDNTSVLSGKLSGLEESIKDINISVEAAPVVSIPVPEREEVDVSDLSLDYEEEVALGADFETDIMEEDLEKIESDFMLMPEMEEETAVEEEVSEDIFAVLEEEFAIMEEEPEEIPEPVPALVIDDPNRAMTPEEIEALIASVNEGGSEPEPEPIPEPEPAPAPVMDDPNRAMTPEEIAALIASVNGGGSEPEPEPVPEPVIDDPNRAMTPEEIAALIASMN